MSANVETMFYVREKPWHGLGTMVQEAPTSAEALKLAGLDWTVEARDMWLNGGYEPIPGYKANVRSSDNKILGVVSNKYRIVQNAEAFAFTDALIGGDVHYETAGSLLDGKKIWLLAKLPDSEICGDKTETYMCFSNTHDGSGAVRVCMTPVRVVCNNTLNLALNTHSERGACAMWATSAPSWWKHSSALRWPESTWTLWLTGQIRWQTPPYLTSACGRSLTSCSRKRMT